MVDLQEVSRELLASGGAASVLAAFIAGLISVLTPCVYPLIPITLALCGADPNAPRLKAFFRSFTYVSGIVCTYTLLGVVSATTGKFFGSFLAHPAIALGGAVVLILLALFTLEIIAIPAIASVQNRASRIGGGSLFGVFLMGAVCSLVAAPCVGPVLVVILGLAANSQQGAFGALLLFAYSCGLGLPFLILGTFSGLVHKLPRSGNWLKVVKYVIATAILGVALALAKPFLGILSSASLNVVFASVFAACGLFAMWYGLRRDQRLTTLFSALCIAGLIAWFPHTSSGSVEAHSSLAWSSNLKDAIAQGNSKSGPIMVDLFAEWCAACKELAAKTFVDSKVQEQLSHFALGKVDFTTGGDEADAITERYKVLGLPCILFLDPSGAEIPESRITGFMPPSEFAQHLQDVATKFAGQKT